MLIVLRRERRPAVGGQFRLSSGGVAWLIESSLLALAVAVALTVVTLIVEYILLVRRDPREAPLQRQSERDPQ